MTCSDLLTSPACGAPADGAVSHVLVGKASHVSPAPHKRPRPRPLTLSLSDAHLSPGVVTDFPRHVVGALHERASDVVIIDGDDDQRKQEVDQEDQDRVDLWVHLIGHRIRHAVHEGGVGVVSVTLRGKNSGGSRAVREGRQTAGRRGGVATTTAAHLHGDDLRENGLGDGEQDGQQPDRNSLQASPEDGAGGLDVHRVDDGLVPDGGRRRRRRRAAAG